MWWALAIALVGASDDRPFVEIVSDRGAVDGAGTAQSARWDRVKLELDVENRLSEAVRDLSLEVSLVRPQGAPIAAHQLRAGRRCIARGAAGLDDHRYVG